MIVTTGTLSTPVVSQGYYYPGIVLSVMVPIRLCLVFSCFVLFLHWHRILTYIKFHRQNFSVVGKATEAIWEDHFCKKCIRDLIQKSVPVLSTEPWLRDEDPSLNGKRNFCYCLSTELIQLSISSVVGYFCTYVYWSGPSTAQVGKLVLHPWHARA